MSAESNMFVQISYIIIKEIKPLPTATIKQINIKNDVYET